MNIRELFVRLQRHVRRMRPDAINIAIMCEEPNLPRQRHIQLCKVVVPLLFLVTYAILYGRYTGFSHLIGHTNDRNATFLPRQTHTLTDWGHPEKFRGWVDVQKQGIPNDYARYVGPTQEHPFIWLAIAFAGSINQYTDPGLYAENCGIVNRTSVKPRQILPNIDELGLKNYFRGWVDAQNQGVANDYAYYVGPTNDIPYIWLTVALAGSTEQRTCVDMYEEKYGVVRKTMSKSLQNSSDTTNNIHRNYENSPKVFGILSLNTSKNSSRRSSKSRRNSNYTMQLATAVKENSNGDKVQQLPGFVLKYDRFSKENDVLSSSSMSASVACFAGDSMVTLRNGSTLSIDRLETGEEILASRESTIIVTKMIMFLDKHRFSQVLFYTFYTISGYRISLTGFHLISIVADNGILYFIPAKEVEVGNMLLVLLNGQLVCSVITKIVMEMKTGYYAPMTTEGTILINNVVASCYANVHNHDAAHYFMGFLRWYASLAWWMSIKEPFGDPNVDGVHPISQILYKTARSLFPATIRSLE